MNSPKTLAVREMEHVCSPYDYALVEAARISLVKPNSLICICVHCRVQARLPADMKHKAACCFNRHKG